MAQMQWQQRHWHGASQAPRLSGQHLTAGLLEDWILKMNWRCTNPACGKELELAKRGKDKLQAKGVTVLECKHCGFEFMVKAEVGQMKGKKEESQASIKQKLDIAVLKKKVKEFELQ